MIVCRKCRASNADSDAFCGSCGAFLEWTGEKVAPAPPPDPDPEPEPATAEARRGLLQRMQDAVGAAIAPAAARDDPGSTWTGFGNPGGGTAAKPAAQAGGAKPSAKAEPPAPPAAKAEPPAPPAAKAEPPAPPAAKAEAPPPPAPPPAPSAPPPPSAKKPPPPPSKPPPPPSSGAVPAAADPPSAPALPTDEAGVLPSRALADPDAAVLVVDVSESAVARHRESIGEEVLPQRIPERVAPVSRTKSTRRLQPGDLVCGQCGEGNPPTRKFCSRCGDSLTTAEVVRPRWYTRLMFWRRGPKTLEAGTRTGQKGAPSDRRTVLGQIYRRVRNAIAGLMLLLSVLYVLVPPLRTPVNNALEPPITSVKDWANRTWDRLTANSVTLPPNEVNASAALPAHPAGAAFDDNTNSFWAAPWNPKDPPFLTVHFDKAVDLVAYAVHAGAPGEDDAKYLHPKQLVILYGSGRTDTIELTPSGDAQTGELQNATSFRFARITVTKVFAEDGLENVAISEIELKEPK